MSMTGSKRTDMSSSLRTLHGMLNVEISSFGGAVAILAEQVAILVFSWIVITLSTVTIVLMASQ